MHFINITNIRRDFLKKKFFIVLLFFIFLFVIPFYYQISFSKYIFNDSFIATKIQIAKKPTIEVLGISNTNTGYEKYANSTHIVSLRIKITEKNVAINHFNRDNIQIFINDTRIVPSVQIYLVSNNNGEMIYDMILSKLTGNGNLNIVFPEGIIEDSFGLKNDFQKHNTNILIDNIAPASTCEELSIENNKSQYIIQSDETLRPIDGWDFYNTTSSLSKVFSSPIFYPIIITDYAGNTSEVFVDIKNAKNIMLYYANYNGYSITQFDSNGKISGKRAITNHTNYKSEMLVMYLDGNIDKNALQGRVFDYTYWGENTSALCKYSEIKYQYGYTPSASTWYDMNSNNVVRFLGKLSLQFGGQGHNSANNSCLNRNHPIPKEIAIQNLYGLSGIALQLNNCDEYSIVYQVYVPNIGWLKASSDGEETTYSHDKPFSAIRINIVPKSEKQYLINYWNRVMYTDDIQ